ncbi:AAA family ATPase [Candidatus Micrarchaeota archaeon]|nr:AAA family ATPase [Candidatus Micrarchaeota archaeon]
MNNIPSLKLQKIKANTHHLLENDIFWRSVLIGFGSLCLLLSFPFFPQIISLCTSLIIGYIGSKKPSFAVLLGILIAFPAVAYQSAMFAWLFLLVISITLFQMFKNWHIIAILEILILAPFAPFPFSYFGGVIFVLMLLSVLYVGSKKSLLISLPAVFLILLLSSVWLVENSAFMPLNTNNYLPKETFLQNSKEVTNLQTVFSDIKDAFFQVANPANINNVNRAVSKVGSNAVILLFQDSAIFQLLLWSVVLFLVAKIPGVIRRNKYKQTVASLSLLLIPLGYYFLSIEYGYVFNPLIFIYVFLTIIIIAILEKNNVSITKERILTLKERTEKQGFGEFGIRDLEEATGVKSLEDIGNYDEVKEELRQSIITPLEHKDIAYTYGIKPPSGILLFGPPGCGKTLIMSALAQELDFGFYYIKASDLLSSQYGDSEKNISKLFELARKSAPSILFFDELDALAKRRDLFNDTTGPRILSLFLQELDGFKDVKKTIVIGATNVPHMIDPAILRPGRFDKIIYMPLPDEEAREKIFQVHTKNIPLSKNVSLKKLAKKTRRYSGADIANICKESKSIAAKRAVKAKKIVPIEIEDFEHVIKHIKPSVSLSALENYEIFRMDFERTIYKEEIKETEEKVKWEDVAGMEEAKRLLLETIEVPLLHPNLISEYKLTPLKGLLMFGPPGCGKTLLIKAAANELNITFLSISAPNLLKRGIEYAVSEIKDIFLRAREQAPAIVFIDEIDTIGEGSMFGRTVIGQLLSEIDGIKKLENVMIVATTNKPWFLDPALLRPGRFDRVLYIGPPDFYARRKMLISQLCGIRGSDKLDYDVLATKTEGYSGADISALIQEVKMELIRNKLKGKDIYLSNNILKNAINKIHPSLSSEQLNKFEVFVSEHGKKRR